MHSKKLSLAIRSQVGTITARKLPILRAVCGGCGAHGRRHTCEGHGLEPLGTEEAPEVVEGSGEPPMEVVVVVVPFWPDATTVN
jgi:hypothetical protein